MKNIRSFIKNFTSVGVDQKIRLEGEIVVEVTVVGID